MTIEDILKKEEYIIRDFLKKEKPFLYISYLNKTYPTNHSAIRWINKSLDVYNWYINNGVKHDLEFYSLRNTATTIICEHFNKKINTYEDKK